MGKRQRRILNGKTVKQWAAKLNIHTTTIFGRIKANGGVFDESCVVPRKPKHRRDHIPDRYVSRIGWRFKHKIRVVRTFDLRAKIEEEHRS